MTFKICLELVWTNTVTCNAGQAHVDLSHTYVLMAFLSNFCIVPSIFVHLDSTRNELTLENQ